MVVSRKGGKETMIDITYLTNSKQEKQVSYASYDDYKQAQFACQIAIADYFPVTKVVVNGNQLDYTGSFGDLYFFLENHGLH